MVFIASFTVLCECVVFSCVYFTAVLILHLMLPYFNSQNTTRCLPVSFSFLKNSDVHYCFKLPWAHRLLHQSSSIPFIPFICGKRDNQKLCDLLDQREKVDKRDTKLMLMNHSKFWIVLIIFIPYLIYPYLSREYFFPFNTSLKRNLINS